MADFFTRLAERALGVALTIEPLLASMYEPEFTPGEDAPLEIVLDEAELDDQATVFQDATPSTRDLSQVTLRPQPSSLMIGTAKEQPTLPASTPLQPYTARAREQTPEQASASPAHSSRSEAPLSAARPDRQSGTTPSTSLLVANAARSEYQIAQSEYRERDTHTESTRRQSDPPTLAGPPLARRAELPTRPSLPSGVIARQIVHGPTIPSVKTRLNRPPGAVSAPYPGRNIDIPPQPTRASMRKQMAREEPSPIPAKEPPEATPAIQVTIGRIEVRATPAPVTEPEKKALATASPVMSLDDYLQNRTKGGHR